MRLVAVRYLQQPLLYLSAARHRQLFNIRPYVHPVAMLLLSSMVQKVVHSSAGTGSVINQATGTITALRNMPGTYTVKYTISDASAPCSGFETSTTVSITKATSAAIKYEPANFCNAATASAVDVILTGDKEKLRSFSIQPSNGLKIDPLTGKVIPAGANPGIYSHLHHKCFRRMLFVCNINNSICQQHANGWHSISTDMFVRWRCCGYYPWYKSTKGGTFNAGTGLVIDPTTGTTIIPSSSTPGTYTVNIASSPPCSGIETSADVIITKAPLLL